MLTGAMLSELISMSDGNGGFMVTILAPAFLYIKLAPEGKMQSRAIQAEAPEVPEGQSAAIVRDLALAADRYLLAGKQNDCISLMARIYDLINDLDEVVMLR